MFCRHRQGFGFAISSTIILTLLSLVFCLVSNFGYASVKPIPITFNKQVKLIYRHTHGINYQALKTGVEAYDHLTAAGKDKQHILTVVDFTQPSTAKRFWVINMMTGHVLYHTYVSQGATSGQLIFQMSLKAMRRVLVFM